MRLVVVGGMASKGELALELPTIIGRSRTADLTIAHPMISRQHCQVFEVDGLVMVRDLGSLNGTMVEGQRISEAALPPDGQFSIGPLTFRAVYEYHGDLSAVPPPKLAEVQEGAPQAEAAPEPEPPAAVPHIPLPDFSSWMVRKPAHEAAAPADVPGDATVGVAPDEVYVPPAGAASDISSWIEGAGEEALAPSEAPPAVAAEPAAVQPEDEEEPEPTPPPNLQRRAARKPPAKPTTDQEKPKAKVKQPPKPADPKPEPPDEADDDVLEDFLKGLQ